MIRKLYSWFLPFFLLVSCVPGSVEHFVFGKQKADNSITALVPPVVEKPAEPKTASQLVLENGNRWISGIPGFGKNALSAFTGNYRMPGGVSPVRIWLTREFLYFSGWSSRNVFGQDVLQKSDHEGRIIAARLEGMWGMILLLPPGLNQEEEDKLITVFTGKFGGFSAQTRNISLPALIPY